MGSETVLADARVRTGSEEIILKARLDHPPSNKALEADESRDSNQSAGSASSYATTSNEVDSRQNESNTDETTPESV